MIRITVVVVGVLGTSITFLSNSVLFLWLLGADLSYTLIFPQLVSVLFFKVTNIYGAAVGYVAGLLMRVLLGDKALGLPVVLHLPGGTLEDGVHVQTFAVRTFSMLFTLTTILITSALAVLLFDLRLLPERWDVRKQPGNVVPRDLKEEPGHDNNQRTSVLLEPILQNRS